jgi:hypothetical protein
MGVDPVSMMMGSMGAGIMGSVLGAYGAMEQGDAQKAAYMYNAHVAVNNSKAAAMKAQLAGEAGAAQAEAKGMQGKAELGAIKSGQSASGLDVNTGSAVAVRQSAKELNILDTQTVRSNAAREAYGYQVQKANFLAEAGLDKYEGQQAQTAGYINAGSTMLGGAGNAMDQYAKMMMLMG